VLIFIGSPVDLCYGSRISTSERRVVVAAFSQWWDGESWTTDTSWGKTSNDTHSKGS